VDGMEVEEIVGAGQLSPEERKRDRQRPPHGRELPLPAYYCVLLRIIVYWPCMGELVLRPFDLTIFFPRTSTKSSHTA
jgi:hypothetical protein